MSEWDGYASLINAPASAGGAWDGVASPLNADQPPGEAAPQASQSQTLPGEDAFRQIGLTGRYLAGGIPLGIAGIGDLANTAINKVAGTNLGMPSDYVNTALDKVYPKPQGTLENAVGAVSNGAVGLMGGGENTVNAGRQAAQNLGDFFASSADAPATSAEAKLIASGYYKQANDIGGKLTPGFTNRFISQAQSIAPQTEEGKLFAGETPISKIVGNASQLADKPISLAGAQEIDEHLGQLIDSEYTIKGLTKTGKQLLDLQSTLRNMIQDAGPEDTVGGSEGFDAIANGRKAWSQAAKMQDIERIMTRAEQSDNPATAIKSGVRTLLSNKAGSRGYTPDEIAALKDAGRRGALGSVLHVFGSRLIPIGAGLVGESVGGPIAAAGGAAVGQAGSSMMRAGATALQTNRLQNLLNLLGQNVPRQ